MYNISQPHIVYKPMRKGIRSIREVSFYCSLFGMDLLHTSSIAMFQTISTGKVDVGLLRSLVPTFYGVKAITDMTGVTCESHSSSLYQSCYLWW